MVEQPVLGKLVTGSAHRDAVHVAVVPVVAGQDLLPGDHVRLVAGRALRLGLGMRRAPGVTIGVVDPFLDVAMVRKGECFWLCLYPGTITSLRHVWTHPAFQAVAPPLERVQG